VPFALVLCEKASADPDIDVAEALGLGDQRVLTCAHHLVGRIEVVEHLLRSVEGDDDVVVVERVVDQ
jgi:hypothetical protein